MGLSNAERQRRYIGRLKAQAAQSVSDGKLEGEVARLKLANQELRTKNRILTKWADDEIAKVKKRWAMRMRMSMRRSWLARMSNGRG